MIEQTEDDLCWNIEGDWYDVIFSTTTGKWRALHKHDSPTFYQREDAVEYLREKFGYEFKINS